MESIWGPGLGAVVVVVAPQAEVAHIHSWNIGWWWGDKMLACVSQASTPCLQGILRHTCIHL